LQSSNGGDRQHLVDLIISDRNYEQIFAEVKKIIQDCQGLDYTDKLANHYINEAKSALSMFPESPTRQSMLEIAEYVITRRI
jgi:octaprenyl-diphosphate synthase